MDEENKPKESQLGEITIALMIFTALCFDGIQAMIGWIPVFGNVLSDLFSIFIFLTFWLWFKTHGISLMTPKRLKAVLAGGIVEIIPYVNLLPAWTGVVVYLIGTTKIKEMAEKHSGVAKSVLSIGEKIKK